MKISEVLDRVQQLKPNTIGDDIIRSFIEECDRKVYTEIVAKDYPNEGEIIQPENERYPFGGKDVELLAKDEYASLYLYYAMAQIDFLNSEYERYNNETIRFNNEFEAFSAWYTSTHKSKMPSKLKVE